MKSYREVIQEVISKISATSWKAELEQVSSRYQLVAAWAAIIFDPIFAVTDYYNIPDHWLSVFALRLGVAVITLLAVVLWKEFDMPSFFIVIVPFVLISLQNAYTYSLIRNEHLLGHNLNYMALLIGAGMFLMWHWSYSIGGIIISAIATFYFIRSNPALSGDLFFVQGGLLLIASAAFMAVLIRTRYNLNVKEIKARLALMESKQEILEQAEEIRTMNINLESLIQQRTHELEVKNKTLEEYAFINAHKLRSPVASILGLVNLMRKTTLSEGEKEILLHLGKSADRLNDVVEKITVAIEKGEKKIEV